MALNSAYVAEYNHRCQTTDIGCAGCPPMADDPNRAPYYYVPTCGAGRCIVVDLRATALTRCKNASECTLRAGTGCCPGCGGTPVALNVTAEPQLDALVCGSEPQACPDCAAAFPEYEPGCVAGQCQVQLRMCTAQNPCPL